jgi:VanZ family protein
MLVIFAASSDVGSARNTSRLIGPILRFFNPEVSDETIRSVQMVVRKGAHVTVYAVLALLLWRGNRIYFGKPPQMSWREYWCILAFCVVYAVSDEFHQSFVSSRYGSVYDVLLDAAGAAAGLLLLRALMLRRKRNLPSSPAKS